MRRLLRPTSATLAATAAATLLVACRDATRPTTPRRLDPPPSAAVSDAVHGTEGSPHFYFLPPLVPASRHRGVFDPSRAPVVEICRWTDAGGCASPLVARFSTAPGGGGSENIRAVPEDELYIVSWHTDQYALADGATYRVRVLLDGAQLGYADVIVVRNSGKAKSLTTGELIPLLDGRTLPIKFRVERFSSFALGTGGGSAATPDGRVTLDVPGGALAAPVNITVAPTEPIVANPGLVGGAVYEFGPDGTTFQTPISITIAYDPARLPAGYREEDVRLFMSVKTDGVVTGWEEAEQSTVDVVNHTVTGLAYHFTQGAALAEVPVGQLVAIRDSVRLLPGWGVLIGAVPLSQSGDTLFDRAVTWASSDPAVADVYANYPDLSYGYFPDSQATIIGHTVGTAMVIASSGGTSDTVWVSVVESVGSMDITPHDPTVAVGGTLQLSALPYSQSGVLLTGRTAWWGTGDPTVATIDQNGVATGVTAGTVEVRAGVDDGSTSTLLRVGSFAPLDGVASIGQSEGPRSCVVAAGGTAYCWGATSTPSQYRSHAYAAVPVSSSLTFASVATGGMHACGVTTSGDVYCWGDGWRGELGNGQLYQASPTPVRIASGETFSKVSPGGLHTCALTTAGAAWCWGYNNSGQLGTGAPSQYGIPTPVQVGGGHVFTQLAAGEFHSCALDTAGSAWCWGAGYAATPLQVPGVYTALSSGASESCGLDPGGAVFCWAWSGGVAPVPGLPPLVTISVAVSRCGLTAAGVAWCWGNNEWGQLGNGSFGGPATPAPVSTQLTFSAVVAGGGGAATGPGAHGCGLTTAGAVVCWGNNAWGQLGDATRDASAVPVNVLRPQ